MTKCRIVFLNEDRSKSVTREVELPFTPVPGIVLVIDVGKDCPELWPVYRVLYNIESGDLLEVEIMGEQEAIDILAEDPRWLVTAPILIPAEATTS